MQYRWKFLEKYVLDTLVGRFGGFQILFMIFKGYSIWVIALCIQDKGTEFYLCKDHRLYYSWTFIQSQIIHLFDVVPDSIHIVFLTAVQPSPGSILVTIVSFNSQVIKKSQIAIIFNDTQSRAVGSAMAFHYRPQGVCHSLKPHYPISKLWMKGNCLCFMMITR